MGLVRRRSSLISWLRPPLAGEVLSARQAALKRSRRSRMSSFMPSANNSNYSCSEQSFKGSDNEQR